MVPGIEPRSGTDDKEVVPPQSFVYSLSPPTAFLQPSPGGSTSVWTGSENEHVPKPELSDELSVRLNAYKSLKLIHKSDIRLNY